MVQVNYEDELECNKESCTIYNGVLVETCLEQADRQAGRQAIQRKGEADNFNFPVPRTRLAFPQRGILKE